MGVTQIYVVRQSNILIIWIGFLFNGEMRFVSHAGQV